jgi:elongation factor Ts
MQIAAACPLYVNIDEVPIEVVEKEKEIYREQMKESGKPDNVVEKIIEGKLAKFFTEVCLMEQEYIKDGSVIIKDLIKSKIAVIGEPIEIGRFTRYQLG